MADGPFLVKLYYRTGAFHRTDEFSTVHQLAFVAAHTFPTCTLTELSYFLADSQNPVILPSPAIGTRIAFRLVQVNDGSTRDEGSGLPRIVIKDLGSVVIGGGGPGAPTSLSSLKAVDGYDFEAEFNAPQGVDTATKTATDKTENTTANGDNDNAHQKNDRDDRDDEMDKNGIKTLADVHFVPGNFISCAIMPPLANGCVVSAGNIRSGRGSGIGEASVISVHPPPPPLWNRAGGGSHYLSEKDHRSGKRRRSYDDRGSSSFGAVAPTSGRRRGDAPSDQDIWVRDGGRSGPLGGSASSGGVAGWPGSRRRRNGR